jgi:hypothetical protein
MFEDLGSGDVLTAVAGTDFEDLRGSDLIGANRVDAIIALERTLRAVQAEIAAQSVALLSDRRAEWRGARDPFLSVAAEVAMARGTSPSSGVNYLNYATGLGLMPHVREAFGTGLISEVTARAIVRESETLDPETTQRLDEAIAPDLPGLTPRKAADLTRQLVVTMDVDAAAEREERERAEQHITHHCGADGVGYLVVRGAAEQMLGIHRSLQKHADTLRATGDPRDRGTIMVNAMFERVTGQVVLDGPDVHLDILLPIEALQRNPVAAELDTRKRLFAGVLAKWIHTRDHDRCCQAGCDCRARHTDHITPHAVGGATTQANGQALCELSNQVKELPGWNVRRTAGGGTRWTTPTGHEYHSPPPLPHRRT